MKLAEFRQKRELMRSTRRRFKVRRIIPIQRFGSFVFKAQLSFGDRKEEIILVD